MRCAVCSRWLPVLLSDALGMMEGLQLGRKSREKDLLGRYDGPMDGSSINFPCVSRYLKDVEDVRKEFELETKFQEHGCRPIVDARVRL